MWADREGYLDITGTVHAYATAAKKRGAEYYEHTKVEALEQTANGWRVLTDKGTITCEHVVNAAGLWAKQVGRMAGIEPFLAVKTSLSGVRFNSDWNSLILRSR